MGKRRVGRLTAGRHAAAVSLPLSLRAPQAAQARAQARALQPSPLLPPALPALPQPIPAHACLPPAPRCRQVSARRCPAPSPERRREGGGASKGQRTKLTRCGGGGAAAEGRERVKVLGKAVGQTRPALPLPDWTQIPSVVQERAKHLANRN